MQYWWWWAVVQLLGSVVQAGDILMMTMGGTKSHTVPFVALSRALTARGHNITFLSGFPGVAASGGAEEISPSGLVTYIQNYTSNWDLLGHRWRGEEPISPIHALRYAIQSCYSLLNDNEFQYFINSRRNYDLVILDGGYLECSLGLVYHFKTPFMYINTVGMFMGSLAIAGNPEPFAITPFFNSAFSEDMNILQRIGNALSILLVRMMRFVLVKGFVQPALQQTFGSELPCVLEMQKNVSFVLHNGNAVFTYPRAFLPNVAEVACMHCTHPRPLSQDLENWVSGASTHGVIVVSMGSSVQSVPTAVRRVFMRAFSRLPHRFIWKLEHASNTSAYSELVPRNVKLVNWLPQQDLLGHPGVVGLISHGGLLSVFEAAWHGKPMLVLPVFCDHDANSVRAEQNGYAIRLELRGLTAEALAAATARLTTDPRYRLNADRISQLLQEEPLTPLQRAIFWTEHVLRHRGAPHFQGAAQQLGVFQWLYLDVIALLMVSLLILKLAIKTINSLILRNLLLRSPNNDKAKLKQH